MPKARLKSTYPTPRIMPELGTKVILVECNKCGSMADMEDNTQGWVTFMLYTYNDKVTQHLCSNCYIEYIDWISPDPGLYLDTPDATEPPTNRFMEWAEIEDRRQWQERKDKKCDA